MAVTAMLDPRAYSAHRIKGDFAATFATAPAMYNTVAEEFVVGSIIGFGREVLPAIMPLEPSDMFLVAHGLILRHALLLAEEDKEIDLYTLASHMATDPTTCKAWSIKPDEEFARRCEILQSQLTERLVYATDRPALLRQHAQDVRDDAMRVRLMRAGQEIFTLATNRQVPPAELLGAVQANVSQAFRATAPAPLTAEQVAIEAYERISEGMGGALQPVKSNLASIDSLLSGGFGADEVTCLMGHSGMGKTSLMLTMVQGMLRAGKRVALYSLEMSRHQLFQKLCSMETGISMSAFKQFNLTPPQLELLTRFLPTFGAYGLMIEDTLTSPTASQISAHLDGIEHQFMPDVIVIDGLWLMSPERPGNQISLNYEQMTKGVVRIARRHQRPILITHQYSDIGNRNDKTPQLADAAGGKAVENDFEAVMGMYRESYSDRSISPEDDLTTVYMLKDRNGGRNGQHVNLRWDNRYWRYADAQTQTGAWRDNL